jgi:peptidoglycan-associated lipoprotein
MKIETIVLPAALALAMIACAHEDKPPQNASTVQTNHQHSTQTATNARRNAVLMSDELRHTCGIEDTGAAPKFDFDSAVLSTTDRNELDQLAKCMTTGPLTGKNVEFVGRADPRGEAEYNMNLGATRADAVKHYLAQLGVTGFRLPQLRAVRSMRKGMTRPRGRWIDASICGSPVAKRGKTRTCG